MASSEQTARLAGEQGYNTMAAGMAIDVLRDFFDGSAEVRYEREGRHFSRGEGWAVSRPGHVAPTMEEARRNFEIPVIRQRAFRLYDRNSQAYMKRTFGDTPDASKGRPSFTWEALLKRATLAGTPDHVVDQIHKLQEVCGINYAITFMDAGEHHDKIMWSLELFGTKVMPAFNRPSSGSTRHLRPGSGCQL